MGALGGIRDRVMGSWRSGSPLVGGEGGDLGSGNLGTDPPLFVAGSRDPAGNQRGWGCVGGLCPSWGTRGWGGGTARSEGQRPPLPPSRSCGAAEGGAPWVWGGLSTSPGTDTASLFPLSLSPSPQPHTQPPQTPFTVPVGWERRPRPFPSLLCRSRCLPELAGNFPPAAFMGDEAGRVFFGGEAVLGGSWGAVTFAVPPPWSLPGPDVCGRRCRSRAGPGPAFPPVSLGSLRCQGLGGSSGALQWGEGGEELGGGTAAMWGSAPSQQVAPGHRFGDGVCVRRGGGFGEGVQRGAAGCRGEGATATGPGKAKPISGCKNGV